MLLSRCNKVLCGSCLCEEIEYCYCKNNCRRNQSVQVQQAKALKNSCDQCLECPNCKLILIKKQIDGKFVYSCSYCSWDTSNIKFISKEENDIEMLIYQLKESNIKGYLKKNYDLVNGNLKKNEEDLRKLTIKRSNSISRYIDETVEDPDYTFNKVLNQQTWEVNNLEDYLVNKKNNLDKKYNIEYNDNYLQDKNNYSFQAVANFLHVNQDYLEKGINKIDKIDVLKDKLKGEYDISLLTGTKQRYTNLISQHPFSHVYFPQFTKFIAKKSKRCKACKKFIVQAEDISRRTTSTQRFELCHLFINQLPYCYVNKFDLKEKYCYLKFVIFDFKEVKIKFKKSIIDENKNEALNNKFEINLPKGVYDLSENERDDSIKDDCLISISERCAILKFTWNVCENEVILRFIVNAEYTRLDTKNLEYLMEIKLS